MAKTQISRNLTRLFNIVSEYTLPYREDNKEMFAKEGVSIMKSLAKYLKAKSFDVHYNKGGIAVSGEVYASMMFTDEIGVYFTIQQDSFGGKKYNILYRTIKSLKDYSGGGNNYFNEEFKDAQKVKKEVYRICRVNEEMLAGNAPKNAVPSPVNVSRVIRKSKRNDELYDKIYSAYQNHFNYGNYFRVDGNSHDRIHDLTHATMLYLILVDRQAKETEKTIFNIKFKFDSQQSGTIDKLLNNYRAEIWEVFNQFSHRDDYVEIYED